MGYRVHTKKEVGGWLKVSNHATLYWSEERTMEHDLIAACEMFLIPATILFGALGVAPTEALKTLISVMGVITSGIWFVRIYLWNLDQPVDKWTGLALSGFFLLSWCISAAAHAKR